MGRWKRRKRSLGNFITSLQWWDAIWALDSRTGRLISWFLRRFELWGKQELKALDNFLKNKLGKSKEEYLWWTRSKLRFTKELKHFKWVPSFSPTRLFKKKKVKMQTSHLCQWLNPLSKQALWILTFLTLTPQKTKKNLKLWSSQEGMMVLTTRKRLMLNHSLQSKGFSLWTKLLKYHKNFLSWKARLTNKSKKLKLRSFRGKGIAIKYSRRRKR